MKECVLGFTFSFLKLAKRIEKLENLQPDYYLHIFSFITMRFCTFAILICI